MKPDDRDESTTMDALHRQASSRVDAAPDPSVRAAVLAAAARAVDARPHAIDEGTAAAPFGRRRWPVSMAALLVVSLMTGLVVNQALRDEPDRVTSAAAPPDPAAPAAPAAPPPSPALAPAPDDRTPSITGAVSEPARSVVHPPAAVAKPERPRADHGHAMDAFTRDASPGPAADRVAPAAKIVATPPEPAPMQAAPAPPVASAPSSKAQVAAPSRPEAAVEAATVARPGPASNTAQRMRRGPEPLTPEAWVERIVKLRESGDSAAADREVEALRARYPEFEMPAAALAPTGTR